MRYDKITSIIVMEIESGNLYEVSVINPLKGGYERLVIMESKGQEPLKFSIRAGLAVLKSCFFYIGEV